MNIVGKALFHTLSQNSIAESIWKIADLEAHNVNHGLAEMECKVGTEGWLTHRR